MRAFTAYSIQALYFWKCLWEKKGYKSLYSLFHPTLVLLEMSVGEKVMQTFTAYILAHPWKCRRKRRFYRLLQIIPFNLAVGRTMVTTLVSVSQNRNILWNV